jgi:hypothetical protein
MSTAIYLVFDPSSLLDLRGSGSTAIGTVTTLFYTQKHRMSCDNSNLESRELEPILGISCAAAFACDSIKLSKLGSGALKPVYTQQCFQNEAIPGLQPFHEEAM